MQNTTITFSAPGKIHLLGEHSVVFGKPAILTTVDLRVTATVIPSETRTIAVWNNNLRKVIEPIIKKHLKIKSIPPYLLKINSQIPVGSGLGSSSAISASYIASFLTFLGVKWDLNLIYDLTYLAEKVFHGNPSGADPATVIFGSLIWFRKETEDLKIIQKLPFPIPKKIAENFILIDTGKPKETTKDMVKMVNEKYKVQSTKFRRLFDSQEILVKKLLPVLKKGDEKELIRIIKEGEKNLESMGVVSKFVQDITGKIENTGGAAKICGAGSTKGPTGILLCYHNKADVIQNIAQNLNLSYFKTKLGVEGLKQE